MGFEVKDSTGESLFRSDFSEKDLAHPGFRSESIEVPFAFGITKAKQWLFDGIRIIYSESTFTEPAELDWKGDTEMINMHFNLQGRISLVDKSMSRVFELSDNQHNLFYGQDAAGRMKMDDLKMRSFFVQFSRETFLNSVRNGSDALKQFAENVRAGKSAALSEHNLEIDLPIQNCINAVLNCNYTDSLKRMFFFSKSIELLVLQVDCLERTLNRKEIYVTREYDRERILFARDYLLKHVDSPPSLTELANIAGINEYKLKRGFKEIFGQTVFAYLADVRLEVAKNDLLEKRKSITEIAFELGYSSLQHFSSAFKKKFGMAPSDVLKRG